MGRGGLGLLGEGALGSGLLFSNMTRPTARRSNISQHPERHCTFRLSDAGHHAAYPVSVGGQSNPVAGYHAVAGRRCCFHLETPYSPGASLRRVFSFFNRLDSRLYLNFGRRAAGCPANMNPQFVPAVVRQDICQFGQPADC